MKISLDEFCNQWVRDRRFTSSIASRFELNVFDFTTLTGEYAKRFFQTSFLAGGFYGTGTSWKPRESKWGKKFTHPIMLDSGNLKKNIKGEFTAIDIVGRTNARKKIERHGGKYVIFTNEVNMPVKGKRGRKRGRYQNYAAVHNSDPSKTNFTVNQYSKRKPVQRQFIGFNKRLDADLQRFIRVLFRGFPGQS